MLYCPRCNNTHWVRVEPKTTAEKLLIFRLRRRYRCLKCNKVMVASIFTDFEWPRLRRLFKKKRSKTKDPACPNCGKATRRSRRLIWERMIPFFRAYRCGDCRHRFRAFG